MSQMNRRTTKPAAQVEINSTAILTSLIHMSEKEAERKALKSNAERNQSQKLMLTNQKYPGPRDARPRRKKRYRLPNPNKNKK